MTPLPVLDDLGRFRCGPYSCALTPASCVARRAATTEARKGHPRPAHMGCVGCVVGEAWAASGVAPAAAAKRRTFIERRSLPVLPTPTPTATPAPTTAPLPSPCAACARDAAPYRARLDVALRPLCASHRMMAHRLVHKGAAPEAAVAKVVAAAGTRGRFRSPKAKSVAAPARPTAPPTPLPGPERPTAPPPPPPVAPSPAERPTVRVAGDPAVAPTLRAPKRTRTARPVVVEVAPACAIGPCTNPAQAHLPSLAVPLRGLCAGHRTMVRARGRLPHIAGDLAAARADVEVAAGRYEVSRAKAKAARVSADDLRRGGLLARLGEELDRAYATMRKLLALSGGTR